MPKHLPWPIWRLVTQQIATLQEIDTHYTLDEVWDANDALDLVDEAQRRAMMDAKG